MKTDTVVGLSGIHRGFAVSVLEGRSVTFAIEEDKLRRFRGLGLSTLEGIGSRALDFALSRVPGGIKGVDALAYVPLIDSSEDEVASHCSFITRLFVGHYGSSPPIAVVDHVSAHLAFERAVHPEVSQVLMAGRSRIVYSPATGVPYPIDVDSSIVSDVPPMAAFLGMGSMQVHHLENMARRGEPRFLDELASLESIRDSDALLERVRGITGVDRLLHGQPPSTAHFDFASSVHALLRQRIVTQLHSLPPGWRGQDLALSGGVFQSWSSNDAIATEFPDTRFRVSFAPGNPACAVGGPLALAQVSPASPLGPFLGPEYSLNEVKSVLDNAKARYRLSSLAETVPTVCRALEDGKMVGWFSGGCEFGYRALGARSVFANPAAPYACENLSAYLKQRPDYFAYAVAMPQDRPEVSEIDSPYLSRSIQLPEYFGESAVRVQTVARASTPLLHQLLETFRERAGVPALLNTSLNYFDEPIACTPRDALKTFGASGLDVLVMDGFLLSKR